MAIWLLKTEPSEYAFADLVREGEAVWDGVANAQARGNLRRCRKGDMAWIYHTGDEKAVVGLARLTSGAMEDPEEPGLNDEGEPRAPVVRVSAVRACASAVTLAAMKGDARFAGWALVTQPRLSVMEVPAAIDAALRKLSGVR